MVTEGMDVEGSTRDEEGKTSEGNKQNPQTTVFVGNLPFETRDDELEKIFSEIGPVKRAFIVKDKDKKSKSRGCGYVQFVLQDDADKCVKAAKSIGNRKLRLSYANKKPKHLKRKALAKAEEGEQDDTETKDEKTSTEEKKEDGPPPAKSYKKANSNNNTDGKDKDKSSEEGKKVDGKTDLQKTIVLTGLTSKVKRKAFRILCEGFGEIENIVYPVPERDEVTAFVRYKEYKSAIRATQKIPGKKVKKSSILSACLLTKENKHPSKKALQKSRLIIRNLSFKCEENDLNEVFSKYGKVMNVNIPTKKVNEKDVKVGCAFVQFAHTENAKAALQEMNLKEIKGREVVVDWAVTKDVYKEKTKEENKNGDTKNEEGKEVSKKKKKKKEKGTEAEDSKMKETEEDTSTNEKTSKKKRKKEKEIVCDNNETETCETDKLEETKQKKKKKKKGKEEEPTEEMNEDISGDNEGATKKEKKKKKKKKGADGEEGNELETKVNEAEEEEHEETTSEKKKTKKKKESPSVDDVSDEDEEDLVVSDVDEGDEDEVMGEDDDETGGDNDDDDDDEDDNDDEEGDDEGDDEDADEDEEGEDVDMGSDVEPEEEGDDDDDEMDEEDIDTKPKREMKDAKEGKTIFIRNLSYDIDEEMLSEEFEKFGEIDYCKLVYDHETGRSKGTAFLKFKQKTSTDKCLEEFEKKEKSGVNTVIDGRPIMVSLAVTKGKLGEMQRVKSDEKKETDKRNLYLAAEGIITRNSPAAEGLSDAELKKREKSLAEKKAKLKNPNFFISRTRLCVKNLPVATDADSLRVALLKHAPRNMKIIELKIMRSKDRRDISGVPRSLGYGFIELDTHEDALALLRATNNNPKIFGEARRPIVEFSVENAKALKILELKKKRIEVKNDKNVANGDEEEGGTGKPKIDRKALKEKIYQKKVKRFARYKRKREQKKLARGDNDDNVIQNGGAVATNEKNNEKVLKNPRTQNNKGKGHKDNTRNNKGGPKNKDNTRNKKEIVPGETSDRGFKRKLPANVGQPIKRERKFGKKKDEKEEEKFNKMVKQYKEKLFGDTSSQTKKKKKENDDRWFQ